MLLLYSMEKGTLKVSSSWSSPGLRVVRAEYRISVIVLQQKCPTIRNTEQLNIIGMLEEIQDGLSRYITPSIVNILCSTRLNQCLAEYHNKAVPTTQRARTTHMVSKTTRVDGELSHDLLVADNTVRGVSLNGLQLPIKASTRMLVLHVASIPTEPQQQDSQLVNNAQAKSPYRGPTTTLRSIDRSIEQPTLPSLLTLTAQILSKLTTHHSHRP